MTVPCQGYQLIGWVAYRCNAPSRWDLVAQSDSDALVSAQCDRCLPKRLREWYDGIRLQRGTEFGRDNLAVLPHDAARWRDEAEDEAVPSSTIPGSFEFSYVDFDPERAGQDAYIRDSEA